MANVTKQITIKLNKVHNFRKVYDSEKGVMYGATCPVLSIYAVKDQIDQILDINPRTQKKSSTSSKAMLETLRDNPDAFVFRNRGITLIANNAIWDNKTEELEINFAIFENSEDQTNGLADGAHTYDVIKRFIEDTVDTERAEIVAEVRLDIITGFNNNIDEVGEIVESRNTSTQVKDETLLNYKGVFKSVVDVLKDTNYANDIAYYENQLVKEDDPNSGYRQINISSVLSYLMCFDLDKFNENNHPVGAYSSKKKALDWFKNRMEQNPEDTKKLVTILPLVLDFRDYIESQIPIVWNSISGRFGDQKGVKKLKKDKKLDFSNYTVRYNIPGGYVYPCLSSFRSLLVRGSAGKYEFKISNLKEFFDQMNSIDGKSLIYKLVNVDDKDPQAMGKNKGLYDSCYGSLRGYYYETLNK